VLVNWNRKNAKNQRKNEKYSSCTFLEKKCNSDKNMVIVAHFLIKKTKIYPIHLHISSENVGVAHFFKKCNLPIEVALFL
jgi:hypothetical protein